MCLQTFNISKPIYTPHHTWRQQAVYHQHPSINRYRGTRGGTRKLKKISTIIGNRPSNIIRERTVIKGVKNYIEISPSITVGNCTKVAVLNARSINNKSDFLKLYITEQKLDLCCISETWLKPDNADSDYESNNIVPEGYVIHRHDRKGKQGGGVAVISKSGYKSTVVSGKVYNSFEYIMLQIKVNNKALRLINIYRPPNPSIKSFVDDFGNLMETINSLKFVIDYWRFKHTYGQFG